MNFGDDHRVYGPYFKDGRNNTQKRQFVITIDSKGVRRTVSYPKYLMELHIGRQLGIDETVDHWDTNFMNNDISNLRIVERDVHSADDTRRVKLIKVTCDWCKEPFERSPRVLRDKRSKGVRGIFCTKSCAGKYSRALQLKKTKKMKRPPHVESEYYKRKYVEADLNYILAKYASPESLLEIITSMSLFSEQMESKYKDYV
jgi:hypothetical protein